MSGRMKRDHEWMELSRTTIGNVMRGTRRVARSRRETLEDALCRRDRAATPCPTAQPAGLPRDQIPTRRWLCRPPDLSVLAM